MKQLFTLCVVWLCSLSAFAQWTKPEAPAALDALPTETVAYLYNADADAFYLGANDWNTRASVSESKGYKVSLVQYVKATGSTWDGVSYKIMTAIEAGSPAGSTLATYIMEWNSIWVDAAESSTEDQAWTFNKQDDGTYLIGLSSQNKTFSPEQNYGDSFLGLNPTMNDTRLYLCDKYSEDYEFGSCKVHWYFVSEENYTAYLTAKAQYEAAVLLGEDLEKAKAAYPSVDLSTVETVYNDMTATAEELSAARLTLVQLLETAASVDSPVDVTLRYVTNPSYEENDNTGWSGTTPGFQKYGNAEFYSCTYDYMQTLTVPAGVYRVSVDAFYRASWADKDAEALTALTEKGDKSAQTAWLYATGAALTPEIALPLASTGASVVAIGSNTLQNSFGYIPNDMQTAADYWTAGQYKPTSLLAMAGEDGQLVIGLKNETKVDGGWTIFDDWKVEYLGDTDAAYVALKDDYLARATDYQAQVENQTLEYYNHADYEAYKTARETLNAATTKSEVVAGLQAFTAASDTMAVSVEAYAAYSQKYAEADKFLMEYAESLMGEDMDLLSDYIGMDMEPSEEIPQFTYGTSLYILKNGLPTAAQVTAEIDFLQKLMDNALANGMSDGADCTDLIKNAHFVEEGIWSKTGLPEWPVGTDDYKMAQGFSILFDVNQTLTGLQNGLYELTLNDFFRPANFGSADYNGETYRAYVYMNNDEAKLNLIDAGATETASADDDVAITEGQYVPNSLNGAASAFQAGRYTQSLYGIVTDGTLKIGVRNDLRYEGCWAVFSDFKLVFRAKNADVLASVVAATLPDAQVLLNNKCGNAEIAALQTAIENAQGESEDAYQALLDLKAAMAAVDSCTEAYTQLQEAISNGEQTLTDYAEKASAETLATLQSAVDAAKAGYESGLFDKAAAEEQATAVSAAVVAVKMGGESTTEKDVSDLIVNNTFDPARGDKNAGTIEGWTTSAMNGYKEYTVSYNRAGIDLKQTLNGLPAGHYRLTVHTYYRAGYAADDYSRYQQDPETSHLTTLYANVNGGEEYSTKVMNLCEDAQTEKVGDSKCDQLSNGLYVPNGTSASVTWFNAGYYLNTLEFDVTEDGTDVTIGLKKTEVYDADYEVVGAWNLYYTAPQKAQDVSSLIVNNTFDPTRGSKDTGTIDGWTTSAMNGYKEYTVSYNRAGIDLWQTIYGLPAGNYKVTVHTYYRAGYADADYTLYQQDPEASHLTTLYANVEGGEDYSTKVMNLCEDAQAEKVGDSKCDQLSNGLYVPNGTSASVTWFNAGYYLNELTFNVPSDNGTVTIGLKKTEILSNDYEVVGEWNLYYYGSSTPTAITSPETGGEDSLQAATPVAFYSLSGTRLSTPQRGVNIIKMSDGSTHKVLVK